jgi:hypothetical protein
MNKEQARAIGELANEETRMPGMNPPHSPHLRPRLAGIPKRNLDHRDLTRRQAMRTYFAPLAAAAAIWSKPALASSAFGARRNVWVLMESDR